MRSTLALVALLVGAVGAAAYPAEGAPLCSKGFDKPARLVFANEGDAQILSLTIGDVTEKFEFGGSAGTGLNGSVYYPVDGPGDQAELLLHTIIEMDSNEGHEDAPEILIFRDRVFWPCERQ